MKQRIGSKSNQPYAIGQQVYCSPLEEAGQIIGRENAGSILILQLRQGTAHVPAGDCEPLGGPPRRRPKRPSTDQYR